jgi:CheY-like chemotaxis protein
MTPKKSLPVETSVPAKTPALKILVAEDVAVNQAVIRLLLSKLGYQADIVSNGREALKALHHRNYDVVLMDVRMPDMDGLTTTHHIYQEIFPRPRIIAMTAEAMPGDKESCLAAGMDDYLSKPISIDLLQQALLRCVPLSVE